MSEPRVFPAYIESVYDGDSLTVMASLGFAVWRRVQVRLDGINAIERYDPGGVEARDHLRSLLPAGLAVTLTSVGIDKYGGRSDGRITLPDGRDVAEVMVADGYAVAWDGRGARPTPVWPIPDTPTPNGDS